MSWQSLVWSGYASPDFPVTLSLKLIFLLYVVLDMVHPNMFSKAIVRMNVKPNQVNGYVKVDDVKPGDRSVVVEVDVRAPFTNEQEFIVHEHMLQWVRIEVKNLGFGVVIGRSDNGSDRRQAFVAMRCERSGTYQPQLGNMLRALFWTR